MNPQKPLTSVTLILVFLLAQVPFSVAEWVAIGDAPEDNGLYNVVIEATYDGVTGSFPLEISVNDTPYETEGLTVEPVYPFGRTPPITLKYEILINESDDFDMVQNSLAVYYASGDTLLKSEDMPLLQENDTGYWYAEVNVPFEGDYSAVISIVLNQDDVLYGGDFISTFSSNVLSDDFSMNLSIDTQILIPYESFEVTLDAIFEGSVLTNLEIFKANIYGTIKGLTWDLGDYAYDASFTAPGSEGIYLLSAYAEDQGNIQQAKVYVVEISRSKSAVCPLADDEGGSCDDMKDVRKCVSDYKSDILAVEESELIQCYEDASGGIIYGSIICEAAYVGDLDGDETLDVNDLETLENMILPLTQSARQDYDECADYDLDGDVDEDDLTCLTNVIAMAWYGDLNGGVCFDAVYDSPLKGDLDGDSFITEDDALLMEGLVEAAENGIEMDDIILDAVDFNQDNRVTRDDKTCLNYFLGMDFDNPDTLLAGGMTIPSTCMAIYELDECIDIKGDINGDWVINQIDEILIMLIEQNQVSGYDMGCADVNKDGRITTEDVECVVSYTSGDTDSYFICIGCTENTPSEYQAIQEICNDGYDNDCDGLIDRTSTGSGDMCQCTSNTPCSYVYDVDGGTSPGVDDGNYQVCRKATWSSSGDSATGSGTAGYQWMSPSDLTCDSSKECENLICGATEYTCANEGTNSAYSSTATGTASGGTWNWFEEDLPDENDDQDERPRTCGDGFDNDCSGGDTTCAVDEEDDGGDSFWWGAGVGFVIGWFFPGASMALALVAGLGGGLLCDEDDTSCSQFTGGFAIGSAVGGMASKAYQGTDLYKDYSLGAGKGTEYLGAAADTVSGWGSGGGSSGRAQYGIKQGYTGETFHKPTVDVSSVA